MAGSHTPFVLVNRAINPLVRGLLRSPAHGLVSGHLALLTVTGRRSGRTFTFPVGYHQDGDRVTIGVDWPERKRWWRNLLDAAPVEIWLAGVQPGRHGPGARRRAHGRHRGDPARGRGRTGERLTGRAPSGRALARPVLASDELAVAIQHPARTIGVVVWQPVAIGQRLQRLGRRAGRGGEAPRCARSRAPASELIASRYGRSEVSAS